MAKPQIGATVTLDNTTGTTDSKGTGVTLAPDWEIKDYHDLPRE